MGKGERIPKTVKAGLVRVYQRVRPASLVILQQITVRPSPPFTSRDKVVLCKFVRK